MEEKLGGAKASRNNKVESTTMFVACFTACLASLTKGTSLGYTSPAIPSMKEPGNPFVVDPDASSWIGSLSDLGSVAGALLTGPMIDALGRKVGVMLTAVPIAAGYALIASSRVVGQVYAGRILTGIGVGLVSNCVSVYIAEIATPRYRGMLTATHQLLNQVGILVAYCMGFGLAWQWQAAASETIPALFVLLMILQPETPRWLVAHGRGDTAAGNLAKIRAKRSDVRAELAEIEEAIRSRQSDLRLGDFGRASLLKPMGLVVGLMLCQQFSGCNAIMFNMASLFEAAGSSMDPLVESAIVGSVAVLGAIPAVMLVDRFGRRVLAISSFSLMAIALFVMGTYFKLKANEPESDVPEWLPLACLVTYKFAFCFGAGPIPWIALGEMFPQRARGTATSVASALLWSLAFTVSKCYIYVLDGIDFYGLYWLFGSWAVLGVVFVAVLLPETKGKSLEEIQKFFEK